MTTHTRTMLFDRVLCGVDGSDEGVAAARAAALVTDPEGALTLVAVHDPSAAVHAGWNIAQILEELAAETAAALDRGEAEAAALHPLRARLVRGEPRAALLEEIDHLGATLVVVGSHGLSRLAGVALGAVSTRLLHDAPCAVLIAKGAVEPSRWPRRIVVGIDGSPASAEAHEAAVELTARHGAELRVIAAARDAHADVEAARRIAPECEVHQSRALDILNVVSETADLVVVGSRGVRGVRSLGSLSERLAHEARCSVLVVRAGRA